MTKDDKIRIYLCNKILELYSRKEKSTGFCECDSKKTLMIDDDGLRCVICKKLIELEIAGLDNE